MIETNENNFSIGAAGGPAVANLGNTFLIKGKRKREEGVHTHPQFWKELGGLSFETGISVKAPLVF